jgi:hypothetical protein
LANVNSSATMALQPEVPNLIAELMRSFSWAAQRPVKVKDKMRERFRLRVLESKDVQGGVFRTKTPLGCIDSAKCRGEPAGPQGTILLHESEVGKLKEK